jgi:energy-coupling factor transport system substrate-specific component
MSPRLLALIPSAVAINLAIGFVVNQLGLPLYLDSVGTVLASALAGPLAGVVTGVVSQVVRSLYEGFLWFPFGAVQVLIALLAGLAAARGGFRSVGSSLAWGLLTGAAAGALSAVISFFVFKGVTATGVTAITILLTRVGLTTGQAVTASSLATDLLDKTIVFLLAGAVLRALPLRVLGRYPWARRALAR